MLNNTDQQLKLESFSAGGSGRSAPIQVPVIPCTTEECRNRLVEGIGNVSQILKERTANELERSTYELTAKSGSQSLHVHSKRLQELAAGASESLDKLQGIRDSTVPSMKIHIGYTCHCLQVVALGESHAGKSTLMNHMLKVH